MNVQNQPTLWMHGSQMKYFLGLSCFILFIALMFLFMRQADISKSLLLARYCSAGNSVTTCSKFFKLNAGPKSLRNEQKLYILPSGRTSIEKSDIVFVTEQGVITRLLYIDFEDDRNEYGSILGR